jgi:hypothetical protein
VDFCLATIHSKTRFSAFREKKIEKAELFLVLLKFDWEKIFQKFQKKMVQEG